MADALQAMTVPLARHGYTLESQTDASLTFVRTYRPWFAWVLTILFFPLGLLAYFAFRESAYIAMTFEDTDGHTVMRATGEGTLEVHHAFATMTL
jgi:hypothetical protein